MTISQEPLVEIDPTLRQNVSCMMSFSFFEWNYFKFMQIDYPGWPPGPFLKIVYKHENNDISRTIG